MSNLSITRTKILEKNPSVPWMDTMVLNPAIIEKDGTLHMLFRATGTGVTDKRNSEIDPYPICLGYGKSTDGGHTWEFDTKTPALVPANEYTIEGIYITDRNGNKMINYANGCIEDPRLFYVEGDCYMTAACRMFPPGPYWEHDEPTQCCPDWIHTEKNPFGQAATCNHTVTVLYQVDLDALENGDYDKAFIYITNLTNAEFGQNRDVIIFPEKMMIEGELRYVMLERPVTPYLNPQFTERKPSMVITSAKTFEEFADPNLKRKMFAVPEYEWENDRIGASAPVLKLDEDTWLLCYHGKQDDEVGYTQNFMLLKNKENDYPEIVFRSGERMITVSESWEMPGTFTIPCVFVDGMVQVGDELVLSYGAADECMGVMWIPMEEVLELVGYRNSATGPLLSDTRFFGELIDCTQPGLEEIPEAAAAGDYAACRRIFATQVRASLQPEKFFQIEYEFGENHFTFPGETEEEAAKRIAKLHLISVGVPHEFEGKVNWFSNPTYNQYKEWTWQLSRHHEWKLLAHQYHLTGDEKHAEVFAGLFDSWVKQAVVPDDSVSGGQTLCWRTIECGIRMGASWPYVLFSFYNSPYFTDDLLVDWYKSVWEHGNRLKLQHRTGNWLIMEMNGLAQIGIFYNQFKQAKEWFDYAVEKLTEELDRQVYPDDFQYELATGYHYVVILNYTRLLRVAKVYDIILPESFLKRLESMLELFVRIMRPDACLPDINDGSDCLAKKYIGKQIDFFPNNKTLQWICNDRIGDGQPDYTSVALDYAGMMIMRTGWNENDIWGFLDAAPFGTGHQHEDKLNFLIHAGGKYILTECGSYAYDDSEMRRYALSTRSHNTVRVNNMDQNRRVCYHWEDEDIQKKSGMIYRIEDTFDYVCGEYDEGYGNCEEDTAFKDKDINDMPTGPAYMGVKHQRSVIFMKQPEKVFSKIISDSTPFFIVIDRLYSQDDNEYEFLWHLDADEITLHGMDVKADFLHIKNSLDNIKTDGVSLIRCQQSPHWQGWKKGPSGIQGDDAPLPTVRYTTHASNTRVVTIFYPEKYNSDVDHCPIIAVEADRIVDEDTFTLVTKDGNRILVKESDFRP